jgi:hypothetical protein
MNRGRRPRAATSAPPYPARTRTPRPAPLPLAAGSAARRYRLRAHPLAPVGHEATEQLPRHAPGPIKPSSLLLFLARARAALPATAVCRWRRRRSCCSLHTFCQQATLSFSLAPTRASTRTGWPSLACIAPESEPRRPCHHCLAAGHREGTPTPPAPPIDRR